MSPITAVPETIPLKLPASEAVRIELAIFVCELFGLEQTNANAKRALGFLLRDAIQHARRDQQQLPAPPAPWEIA